MTEEQLKILAEMVIIEAERTDALTAAVSKLLEIAADSGELENPNSVRSSIEQLSGFLEDSVASRPNLKRYFGLT
jgi:hypothetical protein